MFSGQVRDSEDRIFLSIPAAIANKSSDLVSQQFLPTSKFLPKNTKPSDKQPVPFQHEIFLLSEIFSKLQFFPKPHPFEHMAAAAGGAGAAAPPGPSRHDVARAVLASDKANGAHITHNDWPQGLTHTGRYAPNSGHNDKKLRDYWRDYLQNNSVLAIEWTGVPDVRYPVGGRGEVYGGRRNGRRCPGSQRRRYL